MTLFSKIIYPLVNPEKIRSINILDTYNFPMAILLCTINNSESTDMQRISKHITYRPTPIC